ncbi:hypothetical protein GCK72_015850 [Caenorhabditis remanei]|uniref:Uncharacterized protein n=1 Tax=Caenorhabditis remanei TaxID=31234 RepID=A0A6A5GYB9_CAERE|nr:hypothetical protein GCK72_015850 [Caenorhabditis remanei]KAF1759383.1 hypothetical protein GCK72_015850 [Caenorhabditis remanei]
MIASVGSDSEHRLILRVTVVQKSGRSLEDSGEMGFPSDAYGYCRIRGFNDFAAARRDFHVAFRDGGDVGIQKTLIVFVGGASDHHTVDFGVFGIVDGQCLTQSTDETPSPTTITGAEADVLLEIKFWVI